MGLRPGLRPGAQGSALAGIHAVTSANALHYAWSNAADPRERLLLVLQAVGWMGQFRKSMEARPETMRPLVITDLNPAADDAASRVFGLGQDLPARRAYWADAMRQTLSKADEVHYYKYLAALIEDIPLAGAEWQPHLLAATVYYTKGAGDPEPLWMKRAREALG